MKYIGILVAGFGLVGLICACFPTNFYGKIEPTFDITSIFICGAFIAAGIGLVIEGRKIK